MSLTRLSKNEGAVIFIDRSLGIFKASLERFAKKSQRNVVACYNLDDLENRNILENPDLNPLAFVFGELPEIEQIEIEIARAYGILLEKDQQAYRLLVNEKEFENLLIFDSEGVPLAAILDTALYLLFDLEDVKGDKVEVDGAVRIFELVLKDYLLYLQDKPRFVETMAKRVNKKNSLSLFLTAFLEMEVWGIENELDKIREILIGHFGNLSRHARYLWISSGARLTDEELDKMFEELTKFATGSGKIETSDRYISFFLGQVDITFGGKIYDIGELTVLLDVDDRIIKVVNRTRNVNGIPHPSTDKGGRLLMGEAMYGLAILLGRLELVPVMGMVVPFLHSFDPSTCTEDISAWPLRET